MSEQALWKGADRPRRPNERRRDWPQAITALTALGALIFTGLSLQETREQNSIAQQGEITTRYTTAVEDLGSAATDIRLGGIYALQRIMNDSAPDQPTVVAVLSAYIRDHSPGSGTATSPVAPPTDISAALTVLEHRDRDRDRSAYVDLTGAFLAHVELGGAHLLGANMDNANLRGAGLDNTDLDGAEINGADLSDATLDGAYLFGADMVGANLTGASVRGADLTRVDLTSANLTGVDLRGTTLSQADLYGTAWCSGRTPVHRGRGYVCQPDS